MSYALGSATQKRFVKNYAPFLRNMLIVADRSDACFFSSLSVCVPFSPISRGVQGRCGCCETKVQLGLGKGFAEEVCVIRGAV